MQGIGAGGRKQDTIGPQGGGGAENGPHIGRLGDPLQQGDSPHAILIRQAMFLSEAQRKTLQETPVPVPEATESVFLQPVPYPDNPGWKISERFRKLKKKSSYIIGWLSMDALEEAVVLKDNTFFLTHDVYGKKNANGAIFADSGLNLMTRPYTIFLFGHNMKSGNMFGRLKKYKESAYYFKHRIITFDSEYEDGKYAVFAVADINTEPGTPTYYNLWSLESNRADEREEALNKLLSRSVHANMLDVQPDEQLLVLVTCDQKETDRLVVAARRLRDGESENHLTLPVR